MPKLSKQHPSNSFVFNGKVDDFNLMPSGIELVWPTSTVCGGFQPLATFLLAMLAVQSHAQWHPGHEAV
jgi:hypothetical protein